MEMTLAHLEDQKSRSISILNNSNYSNPWKVFDAQTSGMFEIEYQFNFCDTLPKTCNGKEASAIEYLDIYDTETDTSEILGQSTAPVYHLIDDRDAEKGIMVAFTGGEVCSGSETPSLNGLPRKVLFRFECGMEQDKQVY